MSWDRNRYLRSLSHIDVVCFFWRSRRVGSMGLVCWVFASEACSILLVYRAGRRDGCAEVDGFEEVM